MIFFAEGDEFAVVGAIGATGEAGFEVLFGDGFKDAGGVGGEGVESILVFGVAVATNATEVVTKERAAAFVLDRDHGGVGATEKFGEVLDGVGVAMAGDSGAGADEGGNEHKSGHADEENNFDDGKSGFGGWGWKVVWSAESVWLIGLL